MKCIKRVASEIGISSKFVIHKCDPPTYDKLRPYEIIVQVKACGLSIKNYKIHHELFKKQAREFYNVGEDVSGLVTQIGDNVTTFKIGDPVVGVLPINSEYSGCGEYCVFQEHDVVKKPKNVSYEEAAACIGDCVRTYTALYYHAKVSVGDTVLIMDGASNSGSMAIQLAHQWGAKVLTTYSSQPEKQYLESLQPPVAQMTELRNKKSMLVCSIMEETAGVGVDCVIDNGVRMFTNEDDIKTFEEKSSYPLPHKHDVISCLGFSGKWVTSQPDLQLDPPDCQQLFLRGGSVCFLFDQAWILTKAQHGRYQHILKDSINKMAYGELKCTISKIVLFEEVIETLENLEHDRVGKVLLKF